MNKSGKRSFFCAPSCLILALIFITGCGGGGGATSTDTTPDTATLMGSISLTSSNFTAVQPPKSAPPENAPEDIDYSGYLIRAIDLEGNIIASIMANPDGSYVLEVTAGKAYVIVASKGAVVLKSFIESSLVMEGITISIKTTNPTTTTCVYLLGKELDITLGIEGIDVISSLNNPDAESLIEATSEIIAATVESALSASSDMANITAEDLNTLQIIVIVQVIIQQTAADPELSNNTSTATEQVEDAIEDYLADGVIDGDTDPATEGEILLVVTTEDIDVDGDGISDVTVSEEGVTVDGTTQSIVVIIVVVVREIGNHPPHSH